MVLLTNSVGKRRLENESSVAGGIVVLLDVAQVDDPALDCSLQILQVSYLLLELLAPILNVPDFKLVVDFVQPQKIVSETILTSSLELISLRDKFLKSHGAL